jgi:hypothetical protein
VRYVLVVGADNKVQYRPVKLGPIIDGLRVITDGLTAGETIVVNGLQRVRPGAVVAPERVAMGERRHGPDNKPDTMVARNAKLASSSAPGSAVNANVEPSRPSPTTTALPTSSNAKLALNANSDAARPNPDVARPN